MLWLRQSTAATVVVGPAVSISDGFTPVTNLVGASMDEISTYNALGAHADIKASASLTHQGGGVYKVTLPSTSFTGRFFLYLRDDSLCLPFWSEYMVVPQPVYDALIQGTGVLAANVDRVNNVVVTGPNDFKASVTAVQLGANEFNKIADHVLRRALSSAAASSNGDSVSFRSLLGGLRKLTNRTRLNSLTSRLEVYAEDDATLAAEQDYTSTADADPITEVDTV